MYVIFLNCRSSNLTRKNIHNNVGSLIRYKPLAMKPLTVNQDVPQEREHHVKWHPAIT